jgi:hypothetical protein
MRLRRRANQWFLFARLALTRGAYRDRHGRWARDAMDAVVWPDERRQCGRRSRVVLMPRRWHQVDGGNSANDGGKQARSPGRARRKPLKPLRGECRAFFGVTVVTMLVCFLLCTQGCGRAERPAFPAPSMLKGGRYLDNSGVLRRENARVCHARRYGFFVMAGLDPAIHVFVSAQKERRGSPGQAR